MILEFLKISGGFQKMGLHWKTGFKTWLKLVEYLDRLFWLKQALTGLKVNQSLILEVKLWITLSFLQSIVLQKILFSTKNVMSSFLKLFFRFLKKAIFASIFWLLSKSTKILKFLYQHFYSTSIFRFQGRDEGISRRFFFYLFDRYKPV